MSRYLETITWNTQEEGPPCSDRTVLLRLAGEPETQRAFHDGKCWLDATDGYPIEAARVQAWAELPTGRAT